MKISTKKILLLVATGSVIMLSAFTIKQKVKELREIRNAILSDFLKNDYYQSEYYDAKDYPDTTITFAKKEGEEGKSVLTKRNFYGLPQPYILLSAVDKENGYHTKEFNEIFKQSFGTNISGKSVTMASYYVDEDTKKKVYDHFTFFAGTGIQAGFNKLYVKPTENFEGYSMKKLYNLAAKDYMRDFTKFMVYLMGKKTLLAQFGADYLAKAKADKNFHPRNVTSGYLKKLFPTEASRKQFPNFEEEIYQGTIGSIVRRQCDGTLPVLLSCLKTVLKDYDPEALKLINGKF